MSDMLSPEEFERALDRCFRGLDYATYDLLHHDAAQRARIAELEAKLAALQHIGTGAGAVVRRKYE